MKTKISSLVAMVITLALITCGGIDYKKTNSGLVYKIIKGNSKDSVAKIGNVAKFNVVYKINDSVMFDSHGKMPQFAQITEDMKNSYSHFELLPMMKTGDSAVVVLMVDTLFKKGFEKDMPYAKKGDRINVYMKLLHVYRDDSLAQKDFNAEREKDRPRMEKEMAEAEAKQKEKEEKEMQAYFTTKRLTPVRAPLGTYVLIKEKGTGEPATVGKFITVKYDGRLMQTEKPFEAGVYIFQLGPGNAIRGWHDGIALFNKGGKGTLYVPGTLAYGAQGGPGGPYAALLFDVEVLNVSDTQQEAEADQKLADSLAAKKTASQK